MEAAARLGERPPLCP